MFQWVGLFFRCGGGFIFKRGQGEGGGVPHGGHWFWWLGLNPPHPPLWETLLGVEICEESLVNSPRIVSMKHHPSHIVVLTSGLFLVKERQSELKRYGALFTCLVNRAVHIEVVAIMETDSFTMALQRIIPRRGNITSMSSENKHQFFGDIEWTQKGISRNKPHQIQALSSGK